jgi:ABC-type amino acid transport substrate-binding protein
MSATRRDLMRVALAAPLLPLLPAAAEPQKTISYVRAASAADVDAHAAFGWDVLAVVLERTRASHGDYRLTTTPDPAQALRFRHARTSSDIQVNVVILTIGPDWSDTLMPVRIPLLRGLLGYRLLLIHRQDLDRFSRINTLDDLKEVSFGSVDHWTDTAILKNAGLKVVTGNTYAGLFKMLEAGRFETLTRGVHQIEQEMAAIEKNPGNDIVVEPHLLMHYFLPVYFWFSRDPEGQRRAERVKAGLQMMVADGSLERMFNERFGAVIAKYDLAHRTVIELPDSLLVPEDPINDARLWYRPGSR